VWEVERVTSQVVGTDDRDVEWEVEGVATRVLGRGDREGVWEMERVTIQVVGREDRETVTVALFETTPSAAVKAKRNTKKNLQRRRVMVVLEKEMKLKPGKK